MSIELPAEFGGSASNFFSTLIVIEEIAKVDMSVSVMVDVQNTLICPLINNLGTEEQRNKYLPKFSTNMVRRPNRMKYLW